MAYKVQKPCIICGTMYTPCGDCEKDNTAFHWRNVACSYECGKKYFEKVMAARAKTDETRVQKPQINEKKQTSSIVKKNVQNKDRESE